MLKIKVADDFVRLPFYLRSLEILCMAIDPHLDLTTFHTFQDSIELERKGKKRKEKSHQFNFNSFLKMLCRTWLSD